MEREGGWRAIEATVYERDGDSVEEGGHGEAEIEMVYHKRTRSRKDDDIVKMQVRSKEGEETGTWCTKTCN